MTRRRPDEHYRVRNFESPARDAREPEALFDDLADFGDDHGVSSDETVISDVIRGRVNALDPRRQ